MKENGAHLRYAMNSNLISKNEDCLKEMEGGSTLGMQGFVSSYCSCPTDRVSSVLDTS